MSNNNDDGGDAFNCEHPAILLQPQHHLPSANLPFIECGAHKGSYNNLQFDAEHVHWRSLRNYFTVIRVRILHDARVARFYIRSSLRSNDLRVFERCEPSDDRGRLSLFGSTLHLVV